MSQYNLTLPEATDMAQNRSLWRMWSTYDTTQVLKLRARNDDDIKQFLPQTSGKRGQFTPYI